MPQVALPLGCGQRAVRRRHAHHARRAARVHGRRGARRHRLGGPSGLRSGAGLGRRHRSGVVVALARGSRPGRAIEEPTVPPCGSTGTDSACWPRRRWPSPRSPSGPRHARRARVRQPLGHAAHRHGRLPRRGRHRHPAGRRRPGRTARLDSRRRCAADPMVGGGRVPDRSRVAPRRGHRRRPGHGRAGEDRRGRCPLHAGSRRAACRPCPDAPIRCSCRRSPVRWCWRRGCSPTVPAAGPGPASPAPRS